MPHDSPPVAGSPTPLVTSRSASRFLSPPALHRVWFRLHWLIGITAGSVLVVIGLTGASLAFHEELLDAINPGVRHVSVRSGPVLTPPQLTRSVAAARPGERVAQVTVYAEPDAAARVGLAPAPGRRRGEAVYVDPYSGALQPVLKGADFFDWVEQVHRWLLLPRDVGHVVTGTLASCLFVMALSGLYLRWPRRPTDWRAWLTFDARQRGRPFLRGLHSVVGTCALLAWLVSTSTGFYWAFDIVHDTVDGWARGAPTQPVRAGRSIDRIDARAAALPAALDGAWRAFVERAGPWRLAQLRIPERTTQPLQITWLAASAPHERARSRMSIGLDGDAAVTQDDRYENGSTATRALAAVYPLHMGTYFGVAGRVAMMLAALSLPLFAVTGWMMYVARRRLALRQRPRR